MTSRGIVVPNEFPDVPACESSVPFQRLNFDTICSILEFLSIDEIDCRVAATNRRLRYVCHHNMLWEMLFNRDATAELVSLLDAVVAPASGKVSSDAVSQYLALSLFGSLDLPPIPEDENAEYRYLLLDWRRAYNVVAAAIRFPELVTLVHTTNGAGGGVFQWSYMNAFKPPINVKPTTIRTWCDQLKQLLTREADPPPSRGPASKGAGRRRGRVGKGGRAVKSTTPPPRTQPPPFPLYVYSLGFFDSASQRVECIEMLRAFPVRCIANGVVLYVTGVVTVSVSINWAIVRFLFPGKPTHKARMMAYREWIRQWLPNWMLWMVPLDSQLNQRVEHLSFVRGNPIPSLSKITSSLREIPMLPHCMALLATRLGSALAMSPDMLPKRNLGARYYLMQFVEDVLFTVFGSLTALFVIPAMFKVYQPLLAWFLRKLPTLCATFVTIRLIRTLARRSGGGRPEYINLTGMATAGLASFLASRFPFHQIFFRIARRFWLTISDGKSRAALHSMALNQASGGDETAMYAIFCGCALMTIGRSMLLHLPLQGRRSVSLSTTGPTNRKNAVERLFRVLRRAFTSGARKDADVSSSADALLSLQNSRKKAHNATWVPTVVEEGIMWFGGACIFLATGSVGKTLSWRIGMRAALDVSEYILGKAMY